MEVQNQALWTLIPATATTQARPGDRANLAGLKRYQLMRFVILSAKWSGRDDGNSESSFVLLTALDSARTRRATAKDSILSSRGRMTKTWPTMFAGRCYTLSSAPQDVFHDYHSVATTEEEASCQRESSLQIPVSKRL